MFKKGDVVVRKPHLQKDQFWLYHTRKEKVSTSGHYTVRMCSVNDVTLEGLIGIFATRAFEKAETNLKEEDFL